MTIKPKKKTSKDKTEQESSEAISQAGVGHTAQTHHHAHGLSHYDPHYHHTTAADSRLDTVQPRGRNSPPRWLPSTSAREEVAHVAHPSLAQNLATDSAFEYESIESPPTHKRRHRSSPHHNVRKHRNHSTNAVAVTTGVVNPANTSAVKTDLEFEEDVEEEDEDPEYNSEDEHSQPTPMTEDANELERRFENALKEKKGFILKKMGEDGACLFRSVADQVYGDQEMHGAVRKLCLDYMAKNADFYSQYVTEDITTYINRKRMDTCHGNHLEIQAITELYNRPIEIYQYSLEPMNTFDTAYKTDNPPIRLSYHGNTHYNSIVDPYAASIGVGLGLPGFQPGLAEKELMREASKKSENHHIEQTMLEDKLRETDWEVTQDSIEEQVARESYLQWMREQEKIKRKTFTATATCSSAGEGSHSNPLERGPMREGGPMRSPRQLRSGNNSPLHGDDHMVAVPGSSKSPRLSPPNRSPVQSASASADVSSGSAAEGAAASNSASNMENYGMQDWSEEDILAQVMAQSQQEYLDGLRQRAHHSPSTSACTQDVAGYSGGASTSTSHTQQAPQPHPPQPPTLQASKKKGSSPRS